MRPPSAVDHDVSTTPECKQEPGLFRPVVDRNRCEGKAACVQVCPVGVFAVGTLPEAQRAGLGLRGRIKGVVHRWQQALLVKASACEACGKCVNACPEDAITLERVP
jgi:4Fe-4S ferredoxin